MNYSSFFLRTIVTTGLLFVINASFSQNAVDSLLNVVNHNQANSETYNQLAQEHWFIDIHKSKVFAEKALLLACKEQDSTQIGFAYNRIGTAYLYLNILDSALINYMMSANIFEQLKMDTEWAAAIASCAKTYEYQYEYDKAIEQYKRSLKIFEKAGMSEYNVQLFLVLANFYSKLSDFDNAKIYFNKALENESYLKENDQTLLYNYIGLNYENLGDFKNAVKFFNIAINKCDMDNPTVVLSTIYLNIGTMYYTWEKKELALEYLEKGLEISKSAGFVSHCRTIIPGIADIYLDKGEYAKAKEYYLKVFDYSGESPDLFNEARAYYGLSRIYTVEQKHEKAIPTTLKALDLFEKVNKPFFIGKSHFLLANNYLFTYNLKETRKHLAIAKTIAEENNLKSLEAQTSLLYANYYYITNNDSSSLYYEKYIEISNSLFDEKNQKLVNRFQIELDNLEKNYQLKEAENLTKLKEVELTQKKNQITYITIISSLLFIGVFVFAIMYLRKQRANRVLFLKNKELLEKGNKTYKKGEGIEIAESLQNEIIQKLNSELEENKTHLRNDITLHSLSKILGTNSSYLSKIIQLNYNSNFSTYLNKCRILEAQKMILDKKYGNYTIDAISQECGYNSKSTFNKAFKDFTGLTPKEYKRQDSL